MRLAGFANTHPRQPSPGLAGRPDQAEAKIRFGQEPGEYPGKPRLQDWAEKGLKNWRQHGRPKWDEWDGKIKDRVDGLRERLGNSSKAPAPLDPDAPGLEKPAHPKAPGPSIPPIPKKLAIAACFAVATGTGAMLWQTNSNEADRCYDYYQTPVADEDAPPGEAEELPPIVDNTPPYSTCNYSNDQIVPYDEIMAQIQRNSVIMARLVDDPERQGLFYEFTLRDGDGKKTVGLYPDALDAQQRQALESALLENGVKLRLELESGNFITDHATSLAVLSLLALIAGLGIRRGVAARSQMSGLTDMKTAKKPEKPVYWSDVRGYPEVVAKLQGIVAEYKRRFQPDADGTKIKTRPTSGILLAGPPGTGKTLMAKAMATEAGVPFHAISASQFVEMYVGVGAARARKLFEKAEKDAKEHGGAIIFIDELDAVGAEREGHSFSGGSDERTQALEQLFACIDGFDSKAGVLVVGATNRPDVLDSALTRPGRLETEIKVDLPWGKSQRLDILDRYLGEQPLARDVDRDLLAELTYGHSGADLERLVNETAHTALARIRHAKADPRRQYLLKNPDFRKLAMDDFMNAYFDIQMGPKKIADDTTLREKEYVATHEAGHALTQRSLPGDHRLLAVSMTPRGKGLGHVMADPRGRSALLPTLQDMLCELAWNLGGRNAEVAKFGPEAGTTAGAAEDVRQADALIRQMLNLAMLKGASGQRYPEHTPLNEHDQQLATELRKDFERAGEAMLERLKKADPKALDRLVGKMLALNTANGGQELLGDPANALFDEVINLVGKEKLAEPFVAAIERWAIEGFIPGEPSGPSRPGQKSGKWSR